MNSEEDPELVAAEILFRKVSNDSYQTDVISDSEYKPLHTYLNATVEILIKIIFFIVAILIMLIYVPYRHLSLIFNCKCQNSKFTENLVKYSHLNFFFFHIIFEYLDILIK